MKTKILLTTLLLLAQTTFANETSLTGGYKGILNCPGEGKVGKLYAILEQNGTEISGQFLVNDTIHTIEVGYADDEGVFSMTSNTLDFNGEYGTNFKKISGTSCKKNDGIFKLFKTKNTASIQTKIQSAAELKNNAKAFKHKKACDKGDTNACNNLGVMYGKGDGIGKNSKIAVKYYQKACDGNNKWACSNLASYYKGGYGGLEKNYEKAIKLYQKSCSLGHKDSCDVKNITIEEKEEKLRKEKKLREEKNACNNGDPIVCLNLGELYEDGWDIDKNYSLSIKYYQKSCNGNYAKGCHYLGLMYEYGRGVTQNIAQATKYFQKSCSGGYQNACEHIKKITIK